MTLRSGGPTRPRPSASESLDEEAAEALAQRLLAGSDRSLADLRRRLVRAGAPPDLAARVAARAAARGWVDDARVADNLARRSLERGYGSRRLLADLRARGVDPEVAQAAVRTLATRQEEALSRAAERLAGRRRPGPLDPLEARRMAAALLRRGFDGRDVRAAVGRLARGERVEPSAAAPADR